MVIEAVAVQMVTVETAPSLVKSSLLKPSRVNLRYRSLFRITTGVVESVADHTVEVHTATVGTIASETVTNKTIPAEAMEIIACGTIEFKTIAVEAAEIIACETVEFETIAVEAVAMEPSRAKPPPIKTFSLSLLSLIPSLKRESASKL